MIQASSGLISSSTQYYVTLITYRYNPYIATPEFLAASGKYSFFNPFPVYSPSIVDESGN